MWPTLSPFNCLFVLHTLHASVRAHPSLNKTDFSKKNPAVFTELHSTVISLHKINCTIAPFRGSVMFCDCNAFFFLEAMGVSGRRWRCWAYILFQSRFPPWFPLSPTNLAFGSVHYTVLYSPSIRASLPLDWRSQQNPEEKSLTFIGQNGHEKEDPLGAKKQDTVWCESCFFLKPTLSFQASPC